VTAPPVRHQAILITTTNGFSDLGLIHYIIWSTAGPSVLSSHGLAPFPGNAGPPGLRMNALHFPQWRGKGHIIQSCGFPDIPLFTPASRPERENKLSWCFRQHRSWTSSPTVPDIAHPPPAPASWARAMYHRQKSQKCR